LNGRGKGAGERESTTTNSAEEGDRGEYPIEARKPTGESAWRYIA